MAPTLTSTDLDNDRCPKCGERMQSIRNYERSYKSMWEEIFSVRAARDLVMKQRDARRDLVIAVQHALGNGLLVTEEIHRALAAARSSDTN